MSGGDASTFVHLSLCRADFNFSKESPPAVYSKLRQRCRSRNYGRQIDRVEVLRQHVLPIKGNNGTVQVRAICRGTLVIEAGSYSGGRSWGRPVRIAKRSMYAVLGEAIGSVACLAIDDQFCTPLGQLVCPRCQGAVMF